MRLPLQGGAQASARRGKGAGAGRSAAPAVRAVVGLRLPRPGAPGAEERIGHRAVEQVAREELPGRFRAGGLAVEQHGGAVGHAGGERQVVGHEHDGGPGAGAGTHRIGQHALRGRVEALGGLVEQQQVGVGEQDLREGEQLLLAARQVVGMPRGMRREREAPERRIHRIVSVAAAALPLAQLLGHRIAHEQRLRVLRQQRLTGGQAVGHAPALGAENAGRKAQQR